MLISKQSVKKLSLITTIPLLTILYQTLNKPTGTVHSLVTNLDKAVPFSKVFIIPYLGFYPYVFLSLCYLCSRDCRTYYKTLLAINIGYLFSFLIYFSFQTIVPRPVAIGHDFLASLVTFMYRIDKPYNTFPSLHVLTCFLMIKAFIKSSSISARSKTLIYYLSTIIIISTQLVKQHVMLDLVAAILLGNTTFELVDYFVESTLAFRIHEKLLRTGLNLLSLKQHSHIR